MIYDQIKKFSNYCEELTENLIFESNEQFELCSAIGEWNGTQKQLISELITKNKDTRTLYYEKGLQNEITFNDKLSTYMAQDSKDKFINYLVRLQVNNQL